MVDDYDIKRWLEEDTNDDAGPRLFAFLAGSISGLITGMVAEHVIWPIAVWVLHSLTP